MRVLKCIHARARVPECDCLDRIISTYCLQRLMSVPSKKSFASFFIFPARCCPYRRTPTHVDPRTLHHTENGTRLKET